MFRLFLPTIIRELRSWTKVTLVIFVYDGNGMMAACRLMYAMLPVFPVPGRRARGRQATPYPKTSHTINDMLP